MPDIVSIVAGAVSALANGRKLLKELRSDVATDEHKGKVDDAMEVVSDALDRLAQLQTQAIELQQKNADLGQRLRTADDWRARLSAYELVQTDAGGIVYASRETKVTHFICPRCVEKERQIHILQPGADWTASYSCVNCNVSYDIRRPTRSGPNVVW